MSRAANLIKDMVEVEGPDLEQALAKDEADLEQAKEDLAKIQNGEEVENATEDGLKGSIKGLEAAIKNKKKMMGKGESKIREESDWLANELEPAVKPFVSKVSSAAGYDITQAMAFCVALLEDVNAHKEAAEINKLFIKSMEV
jgi:hypothetical protein